MKYVFLFILLAVSFFLYTNHVMACEVDFKLLEASEPSPCKGYFLSIKKEKETRYKLIEYDFLKKQESKFKDLIKEYKKQVELQDKHTTLLKKERDLWKQQAIKSTESLLEQKEYGWLYYLGGILTAVVIGNSL